MGAEAQTAEELIARFALKPHPFDGWCAPVETARVAPLRFHYLIRAGEYAHWHKSPGRLLLTLVDGAPLTLSQSATGRSATNRLLRPGADSTGLIEPDHWRSWESMGAWSLLIASVEHEGDFFQWELAPDDWHPQLPA